MPWGAGRDHQTVFKHCWQGLMDEADTAIGVFVADLTSGFYLHESFARICRRVHRRSSKPMAMMTNHVGTDSQDLARRLTDLGIPVIDGTVPGLFAVRNVMAYRDFAWRPANRPYEPAGRPESRRTEGPRRSSSRPARRGRWP